MATNSKPKRWWLAIGTVIVTFVGVGAVQSAAASDFISIPIEQIVRGAAGEEILVATAAVPAELIGLQCEMVGETFNQESVHIGNDLLIRLGDQTRIVENFEDAEDVLKEFRQIEEMPSLVEVFVRLGPDGVSSGGFLISIECATAPPETTTTTSSTTTTTSLAATTTTMPTTTIPTTTTTLETVPTTVTAPPTTLILNQPTVSTPPTTTTTLPDGPAELAVTGTDGLEIAAFGFASLAAGLVLAAAARRRTDRTH